LHGFLLFLGGLCHGKIWEFELDFWKVLFEDGKSMAITRKCFVNKFSSGSRIFALGKLFGDSDLFLLTVDAIVTSC
jgi:hypothetical protein